MDKKEIYDLLHANTYQPDNFTDLAWHEHLMKLTKKIIELNKTQ